MKSLSCEGKQIQPGKANFWEPVCANLLLQAAEAEALHAEKGCQPMAKYSRQALSQCVCLSCAAGHILPKNPTYMIDRLRMTAQDIRLLTGLATKCTSLKHTL